MILACGEALVDMVTSKCGEEEGYVARPGGSPCNVAVGLARLGVPAGFLGRLSTDSFGTLIRHHLGENGVDTRYVREGREHTTLGFVHHSGRAEVDYTFYVENSADRNLRTDDLPPALDGSVAALHFGSLATVLEPVASTLEELVRRERGGRLISLDPNIRPRIIEDAAAYRARLESLVGLADLVKLSAADTAWLYPDVPLPTMAARWLGLGAALVVVTRGGEGSTAFGQRATVSAPAPQVEVVDTVGAGDAFTSGSLAWLHDHGLLERSCLAELDERDLAALLSHANRVAALTCTRVGAAPPWLRELADHLSD
jgi:fructokinase